MIIIKYNELLKENKTLQRKIKETKIEKERLLNELKENPVAELIRMAKGLDIF